MELREWRYMNPPNSNTTSAASTPAASKTNKEKFTELVAYMQKHKDSSAIFTSVNGPNDTGFECEGQRAFADGSEYNLSVEVSLGKHDLFTIHIDIDGKRKYNIMAKGWRQLLEYLSRYFHVPKIGSPEYKSLTESFSSELKEWKLMSPPQSASNNQSQKYRYERLLAQIDSDGISTYTVHELNDTILDMTTNTKSSSGLMIYRLRLTITYYPDDDYYILKWNTKEHRCEDFEDALKILIKNAVIVNTGLCESAGSIADDFKLYENLWD